MLRWRSRSDRTQCRARMPAPSTGDRRTVQADPGPTGMGHRLGGEPRHSGVGMLRWRSRSGMTRCSARIPAPGTGARCMVRADPGPIGMGHRTIKLEHGQSLPRFLNAFASSSLKTSPIIFRRLRLSSAAEPSLLCPIALP